MKKVITYGTFDLLHHGHINLLKRAKEMGDYLIAGVTTENFDVARGKLLVQQPLNERIEALKNSGYVDEVILEEYEGQKIDDIKKHDVDLFVIGSDWVGKFDYLNEYCRVIYLDRTEGVSSTELRMNKGALKIGIAGFSASISKFIKESKYISGVEIDSLYVEEDCYSSVELKLKLLPLDIYTDYGKFLENCDAVYITTSPASRPQYVEEALLKGKHVLCETPISMSGCTTRKLTELAEERGLILYEALKTAYSLAFNRMLLLLKGGIIGKTISLEVTCTSLEIKETWSDSFLKGGGSLTAWGSYVLFAAFSIFGYCYDDIQINTLKNVPDKLDIFNKINISYPSGTATLKVGTGVKSEGEMIISGTNGYIFVPAPWWKMDYFEVRREDSRENRRYFYSFEGEGIRHELAEFLKATRGDPSEKSISGEMSMQISKIIENYRDCKVEVKEII